MSVVVMPEADPPVVPPVAMVPMPIIDVLSDLGVGMGADAAKTRADDTGTGRHARRAEGDGS
jgi:hypothetical protein